MPSPVVPVVSPVVVMLRAPSAVVLRKNAMYAARRGGRVNRERSACGRVCRTNAIISSTRRRTRCCDAQGAGAVVLRKNAICRPSCSRVNRERVPRFRKNAISVTRRVPVVVMLRAPVP